MIKQSPKKMGLLNSQNLIQKNPSSNFKIRSARSINASTLLISNYQIREKLGKGSFAKVYKAIHLPTSELVAVKIFNKTKMSYFQRNIVASELEIHKRLQHQNIVRLYEYQQTQTKIYLFMEYCSNGQLFNYINSQGPLSELRASVVFKQILSAMKYLKSQQIFHRDIKCQNILFDKNWNAKLVDFGFATRELESNMSKTFCGSPSYTAPQLLMMSQYRAQKIDVWCLGVTLFAMLQGTLPFDGKQPKITKKNIIDRKYEIKIPVSPEVKQIFKSIFVPDTQRALIQDLQETAFFKKSCYIAPNFINTEIEQITVDPQILELIENQFPSIKSSSIVESVTQFKLDSYYALYYLMVQNRLNKGKKVKYDIHSRNFQKRTKRLTSLRLKKLSSNHKKILTERKITDLRQSQLIPKKLTGRTRPTILSIGKEGKNFLSRNNSVDSPRRKNINSLLKIRKQCQ